ncbi:hypothetical protein PWG71_16060 [Nocardiopsis sp. N85]|uniref:hypothetical protein n=1 Tax=Nocardiopsis sp. N85 TaxID=3029400 RepID=UPI00237EE9EA|nr:hypothetical protein [Nocardiopsis sp. N85]MDE3722905.1 hypothetical protein [Nocardiopsis sp. N85]
MDFLELQRRLREAGHDAHLAYDGRHDPFRPTGPSARRGGYCRGAWNLYHLGEHRYVVTVRDLTRPVRFARDTTGPEPAGFRTEEEACAHLWEILSGPDAPEGVRDIAFDALPEAVAGWIRSCGGAPTRTLFGNPFVASRGSESHRLSRVGDRYVLRRRSNLPPTVGVPFHTTEVWEDACRVLMSVIGDRDAPRRRGLPLVGFARGTSGEERARRLAGAGFEEIARAYGAERGEPLLDVLAEAAALDLVTPEILRLAGERHLDAQRFGSGRCVTFGFSEERYRVREVEGRYLLERAGERENAFAVLVESPDLDDVRRRFVDVLDPAGTRRDPSAG